MIEPMKPAVVGIDPGLDGGIAFMSLGKHGEPDKVHVQAMPTKPGARGRDVDGRALYRYLDDLMEDQYCDIKLAAVEIVHSMPKQGVSSSFNFGKGYGRVLGVVEAMAIPLHEVTPQKWKKVVLDSLGREKQDAIRYVISHFPELNLKKTDKCTTHHDGMAEAVCLAEFARQYLIGLGDRGMTLEDAGIDTATKLTLPAAGRVYSVDTIDGPEWKLDYVLSTGRKNTLTLDATTEADALAEAANFLKVDQTKVELVN